MTGASTRRKLTQLELGAAKHPQRPENGPNLEKERGANCKEEHGLNSDKEPANRMYEFEEIC